MENASTKSYHLIRRIKDQSFDVDDLHNYTLMLSFGIRDFQLCVINGENRVLLLEDFRLENIRTINSRIEVLQEVFDNHHLLKAGFWKAIKVALKTHKYTLVPKSHFIENAVRDYLLVNSELKPGLENAMYYKHISSDAVNVFAGDMRLLRWIKTIYPNKQITVAHQGSAFIEGLLRQDDHPHNKAVFCLIEKGILHVVVTSKQNLLYYNQFAIKQNEEYLKYLLLVFRELSLDQKSTRVIVWGNLKPDSQLIGTLKKYIRDISFGNRPSFLKFNYHFDEISDHQYFDLFNIFLCD